MVNAAVQFLFWLATGTAVAAGCAAGLYLLQPSPRQPMTSILRRLRRKVAEARRHFAALIATLCIFFAISLSEGSYVGRIGWDMTHAVEGLEGTGAIIWLQGLETPTLTALAIFFYIFVFSFILVFAPAFMAFTGERRELRRFVHSVIWMHVVSLPVFVFFQVTVTSLHSADVKPLLYSYPLLKAFAGTGGFYNSFPSSHVYMTAAVFLSSVHVKGARRYTALCGLIVAATIFAVLYLGIHWLSDVAGGLSLAMAAHLAVRTSVYEKAVDRVCLALGIKNR